MRAAMTVVELPGMLLLEPLEECGGWNVGSLCRNTVLAGHWWAMVTASLLEPAKEQTNPRPASRSKTEFLLPRRVVVKKATSPGFSLHLSTKHPRTFHSANNRP